MKKVLIAVLMAAGAVTPVLAQGHGDWVDRYRNGNATAPAPQAARPQAVAPQMPMARGNWQGGGNGNRPQAAPQVIPQNNWARGGFRGQTPQQSTPQPQGASRGWLDHYQNAPQASHNDGHWNHGNDGQRNRSDGGQWNRGNDGRAWNRDWRRDQRYNWQAWRGYNRNYFRIAPYYNPYGWGSGYIGFGIGSYMDDQYFGSDYWIADPYYYHLPPTYGDTRWVRYYNDVLLVDIDTGEVLDVIHNFFW